MVTASVGAQSEVRFGKEVFKQYDYDALTDAQLKKCTDDHVSHCNQKLMPCEKVRHPFTDRLPSFQKLVIYSDFLNIRKSKQLG